MKKIKPLLLVLAAFSISVELLAQNPVFTWAGRVGGAGTDKGTSITTDASGNVYTTGVFNGSVDFDPGPGIYILNSLGVEDIFISKLNSSGNLVWARSVGGSGVDRSYSICTDASGNVYITGYFYGIVEDFDPGPGVFNLTANGQRDIFILKLNSSGNFVWAKSVGSADFDEGLCITVSKVGNVYTTGYFSGIADFDPGPGIFNLTPVGLDDIFILKLDSSGNFIWARSMGGSSDYDDGQSIAVDSLENVYTTGTFQGTADFDPGIGSYNLSSSGSFDIFISKLDAAGHFVWAKRIGGGITDISYCISVDASGNVYTSGFFESLVDFNPGPGIDTLTAVSTFADGFILKLDSSGNFVCVKRFGAPQSQEVEVFSSVIDTSGNIFITGMYNGTADFDPGPGVYNLTSSGLFDIFILKLDASGNFIWARGIGASDDDVGIGISNDVSGNVFVTGYFHLTVDFDFGTGTYNLTAAGADIFVLALNDYVLTSESEEHNALESSLYPNPATNSVAISLCRNSMSCEKIFQYSILDSQGNKIFSGISAPGKKIDISALPSGIYALRFFSDKISGTKLFVKSE